MKNTPFYEERGKNMSFSFIFERGTFMQNENTYKTELIKRIEKRLPGAMVFHLDPNTDGQGIPDLLVLYKNKWATLECKKSANASKRPNQEYYVGLMNKMSFSRFICPENKDEVLKELKNIFK